MDKIKFLRAYFSEEEVDFFVAEILSGSKIQLYYISNENGQKTPLDLKHVNTIYQTHPNTARITFRYSQQGSYLQGQPGAVAGHLQNLGLKDLMADITQVEKLLPLLDKTKAAIARRKTKDYTTKLLECLHEVIEMFWLNFDFENPPKQEVILLWLHEEKNISGREALAIDLIARNDRIKEKRDRSRKKPFKNVLLDE